MRISDWSSDVLLFRSKDDVRRAAALSSRGVQYVDVGTSGGVWGLDRGYCLMVGGAPTAVDHLDPIFAALAPGASDLPLTPGRDGRDPRVERGSLHFGPSGPGLFVQLFHNVIERALGRARG